MQNGLVSIIIPFKNTGKYLSECLDSIQIQTYPNWEVIAVNDSSTDASSDLVSQYAKNDTRIKVLQNQGNGIIPALQTAYSQCSGQFVTRMDSDDIMFPRRLEIMVESLQEHGERHLAIGQVHYFSENGIGEGYRKYEEWLNGLTHMGANFTEIYKECVIPSPCWMVFKSDFEACGGFSSERYPEDYDLAFRFYESSLTVIPCNEVLHKWRDYDTRASRTSEHYAQNYFLDIKLHYYLKLEYDTSRPLVIWGAGKKGKTISKKLIEKEFDFIWFCDNPKKIGSKIYDKPLYHFSKLSEVANPQIIITVANSNEQEQIRTYLKELGHSPMKNYFFFC